MKLAYGITDRKPFVKALEEITGMRALYMRVPTCTYRIEGLTVTREGDLLCDESVSRERIAEIIEALEKRGFTLLRSECEASDAENAPDAEKNDVPTEEDRMGSAVSVPANGFNDESLGRLKKLVDSKAELLKKALGTEELSIEQAGDHITFPWFENADGDHAQAYAHLVTAMCDMAKNARRITAKQKEYDNEKYAFRCFLLRLGFIGEDYKRDRKILLERLTGSAAFKTVAPKEVK